MTSVNNTKNSISAYSGQIAEAQAQADALGNQIAEQDKNIAALKKTAAGGNRKNPVLLRNRHGGTISE